MNVGPHLKCLIASFLNPYDCVNYDTVFIMNLKLFCGFIKNRKDFIEYSLDNNLLNMAKLLIKKKFEDETINEIITYKINDIIKFGCIKTLKHLDSLGYSGTIDSIDIAIRFGRYDTVRYLIMRGKTTLNQICTYACRSADRSVLKTFALNNFDIPLEACPPIARCIEKEYKEYDKNPERYKRICKMMKFI